MYEYAAVVEKVIDGDTAHLAVDLGFSIKIRMPVRLYGINAPELHGVADPKPGQAARAWLAERIEGKSVVIRTFKDKKEKYGRILAQVYLDPKGSPVNDEMVKAGFAKAYFGGER